jgi:hypothetical protein
MCKRESAEVFDKLKRQWKKGSFCIEHTNLGKAEQRQDTVHDSDNSFQVGVSWTLCLQVTDVTCQCTCLGLTLGLIPAIWGREGDMPDVCRPPRVS